MSNTFFKDYKQDGFMQPQARHKTMKLPPTQMPEAWHGVRGRGHSYSCTTNNGEQFALNCQSTQYKV